MAVPARASDAKPYVWLCNCCASSSVPFVPFTVKFGVTMRPRSLLALRVTAVIDDRSECESVKETANRSQSHFCTRSYRDMLFILSVERWDDMVRALMKEQGT